jgi:hypothetical protein
MWFNLAAAAGDEDATANRDKAALRMGAQQIAQAQRLARECQARDFKGCN